MNPSILIVEDDRTTILMIQKFITDLGYDITDTVSTGEDAIQSIKKKKPDIVLMDITLKGEMDGIDSAKRINEETDVPVIYLTSSSDRETIESVKKSNPYGYIIKPINKETLKVTLEMASLRFSMERRIGEGEQKFKAILNSISDAVIVTDASGIITYMNPVAERLVECKIQNTIGKRIIDLVNITYSIPEPSSSEKTPELDWFLILTKSGKKIPVDYRAAPIKDQQKETGSVIVFRDFTGLYDANMKIQESFAQLRKAMGGIIQAMAHTIETRDPYTAGHQRRVSDLAREIASRMQLQKNVIESIRLAGVIHDIGKISVPAEILSMPRTLTDLEFNLIKIHPQIGYDILKPIEFPWPIAEIVYQHHERIDGSGYPAGLRGEDIMIEARILAVADVVEAMASHRPYRAALGIEKALNEISANRGKYYDENVTDVCLDLFRNRGYSMKY
ncbi:MAG: response regulator [Spirochaetes bacterium]|jgi:PAS domain S-box-containing protein|nr:response regulator [Spirochaetota bacterium]